MRQPSYVLRWTLQSPASPRCRGWWAPLPAAGCWQPAACRGRDRFPGPKKFGPKRRSGATHARRHAARPARHTQAKHTTELASNRSPKRVPLPPGTLHAPARQPATNRPTNKQRQSRYASIAKPRSLTHASLDSRESSLGARRSIQHAINHPAGWNVKTSNFGPNDACESIHGRVSRRLCLRSTARCGARPLFANL